MFRFKLDDSILTSGAHSGRETLFKPDAPGLAEGKHTLYVQERDSAGNWSETASKAILIDLTPPLPPKISSASFNTTSPRPTWLWTTGGNGGNGIYRYGVDDSAIQATAILTSEKSFTPTTELSIANHHILYVQERDSAGNWSALSGFRIHIHGQTGFAAGTGGIMFRTINGGVDWDTVFVGTTKDIHTIFFISSKVGFAAGDSGVIVKTVDGGSTWAAISLGISANLNAVFFPNNVIGYAVGQNGIIRKTIDAGVTWTALNSGTKISLMSIFFTSPQEGYAAGDNGLIIKTVDEGMTWIPLSSGLNQPLQSVYFTDDITGYAVGGSGTILKTINGGNTWKSLNSNAVQSLQSIYFTGVNTGYAVGLNGHVMLKSLNGGDSWNEIQVENTVGSRITSLLCTFFVDPQIGYAVGKAGPIFRTENGGETWKASGGYFFVGPNIIQPDLFSVFFP